MFNVSRDSEEVMSDGKMFHVPICIGDEKDATSNSRKSDGRNTLSLLEDRSHCLY